MPFDFPPAFDQAIARFAAYYNAGNYDPTGNPGGFGNNGHRQNFLPFGANVATVGEGLAAFAEYLETSVVPLASSVDAAAAQAVATVNAEAAQAIGSVDTAAAQAIVQVNQSVAKLTGTSATSNTLSLGAKTWTTQENKFFAAGTSVTAVSRSNPSALHMSGVVTGYSGASLTVNVTTATGTGTYSDWTIYVAGEAGRNGSSGWSSVEANVSDGANRVVVQVTDWTGGTGAKPPVGYYKGALGPTNVKAEATNIRGADGAGAGDVNTAGAVQIGNVARFADSTGNLLEDGGTLALVAITGSYADLSDPPNIPTVPGDIGAAEASALTAHTGRVDNPHAVTKAQVGLGNVSNLAPADMPVSSATASALAGKQNALGFTPENVALKGQPNGYASLGPDGKVPAAQSQQGGGGGGAVTSVNGQTGAVSVSVGSIGAASANHSHDVNEISGFSSTGRSIAGGSTSSIRSLLNIESYGNATSSTAGLVELATTSEAESGSDSSRAVTPAGLQRFFDTNYIDNGTLTVGRYALLRNNSSSAKNPGDTISGSSLNAASGSGAVTSTSVPGTWKCCGYAAASSASDIASRVSSFQRIS